MCSRLTEQNAADWLVLADRHHAAQLRERCISYIIAHSAAVMCSEGYKELAATHPSLMHELLVAASGHETGPASPISIKP